MKLLAWLCARLGFVIASLEFGAERVLFTPPRFSKKREYVEAREKVKLMSFHAKNKNINRRGIRGK